MLGVLARLGRTIPVLAATVAFAGAAHAQQPYPQQPPPQQPYPQQPSQPQPYPPPQQPYPQPQPYPPPQQPYPQPQPYPPPQQPYPQPQPYPPPQQPYPQQQQLPPQPPPPPAPPPTDKRGSGEMTFLYITSGAYGLGTGIWVDGLFKVTDPGLAAIAPIAFAAAMPVGVYFWDDAAPFHRGVPASIATGLTLGAVEGIAISGTQWQYTHDAGNDWSFRTQSTITWIMATGGGVGGWAFGEWLRPDPRSLGFIAGGAGWGAISGTLLGAGASGRDWKDGASVAGLVGFNLGVVSTGAISTFYTPSWQSQKWMWIGELVGTAAGSIVYPFYLFSDADPKHGLIANSLGGLAGVGLAGALTIGLKDDDQTNAAAKTGAWKPPFVLGVSPQPGGAAMNAYGTF